MKRFVEGIYRDQATPFPECLEDWVAENNAVRVIEAFVEGLDDLGLTQTRPPVLLPAEHLGCNLQSCRT